MPARPLFLPPYDTRTTLAAHGEALMRALWPARVIALGDSFHDGEAADRLDDDDTRHARRPCVGAPTGSGSPAITIPIRPPGWAAR